MAKKGILDINPDEARAVLAHKEDGVWRVESRQDCDHIVRAAQILADQPPGKDFRHIGVIPKTVLDQAFNEGWFHDKAKWRKWLKENPAFQVHKA